MVIPKPRTGYSRVTHPFAARVPRRAFPLDLHVLSTPPAFVLSQDQTLQQKPAAESSRQQTSCQRNQPQKTRGQTKQLALAFTNTLLSSQKTNTHRQQALGRAGIWGNHSSLLGQFWPCQEPCPDLSSVDRSTRANTHRSTV